LLRFFQFLIISQWGCAYIDGRKGQNVWKRRIFHPHRGADFFCYLCSMPSSFSNQVIYNRAAVLVVVVPRLRQDGMHYEINIKGFPRFEMKWSALGRYDVAGNQTGLPYELILAVSDLIEKESN